MEKGEELEGRKGEGEREGREGEVEGTVSRRERNKGGEEEQRREES